MAKQREAARKLREAEEAGRDEGWAREQAQGDALQALHDARARSEQERDEKAKRRRIANPIFRRRGGATTEWR